MYLNSKPFINPKYSVFKFSKHVIEYIDFLSLPFLYNRFNYILDRICKPTFKSYGVRFKTSIVKKKKKLLSLDYKLSLITDLSSEFLYSKIRIKKFRLKRISFIKPKSYILKSRRFLRLIFNRFKIRSHNLSNTLLKIFSKSSSHLSKLLSSALITLLLNSGIIYNLYDCFYLLRSKSIQINSKVATSYLLNLKSGDFVNVLDSLFISSNFLYLKYGYNRWLLKKYRRNSNLLKKYINTNKSKSRISLIFYRWLYSFKSLSKNCKFFEVDYRISSLLYLYHSSHHTKNLLNVNSSSLSIYNLWYYKF